MRRMEGWIVVWPGNARCHVVIGHVVVGCCHAMRRSMLTTLNASRSFFDRSVRRILASSNSLQSEKPLRNIGVVVRELFQSDNFVANLEVFRATLDEQLGRDGSCVRGESSAGAEGKQARRGGHLERFSAGPFWLNDWHVAHMIS